MDPSAVSFQVRPVEVANGRTGARDIAEDLQPSFGSLEQHHVVSLSPSRRYLPDRISAEPKSHADGGSCAQFCIIMHMMTSGAGFSCDCCACFAGCPAGRAQCGTGHSWAGPATACVWLFAKSAGDPLLLPVCQCVYCCVFDCSPCREESKVARKRLDAIKFEFKQTAL